MSFSIFIRPWLSQDIEICTQISSSASEKLSWSFDDYQSSFNAGHFGLIAIVDQKAVGCLVAQPLFETVDLLDIQVHPKYHGKDIAQQLMLRLVAEFPEIEQIMLEVRQSNLRAQKFYKKTGFEAISIRKNYYAAKYDHVAEDAVIMQLKIKK